MNLFNQISLKRPKLNKFNLSAGKKLTFQQGELVPMLVQEIVPGDRFRVQTQALMRLAPLLAPLMHEVNIKMEYFFVPNRLIWTEWETFITGGPEGTSAPVAPYMRMEDLQNQGFTETSLLPDYMGLPNLPAGATVDINVSALPFRAYTLIWNEYYRDQNLQAPIDFMKGSGIVDNSATDQIERICTLRQRCWEKDYFTSALPWAQRGGDVSLPIDGLDATVNYRDTGVVIDENGDPIVTGGTVPLEKLPSGNFAVDTVVGDANLDNIESIDISGTSTTINELRRSIRLQEWLEKNARAGARYVEQILAHFGVKSSDARLQRPEYLGGSSVPLSISEVLSTVQQVDSEGNPIGNPQGDMTGRGIGVTGGNGFQRTFEEHGFVIGLISVLPRTAYQQGVPRMFSRTDKTDYYWPEFAQLGEQEVKMKEVFYNGQGGTTPEATFGYQSRYAEYKYNPGTVHGQFRDSLAFWGSQRIFASQPALNEDFVQSDPTNRIFAVQDAEYDHLWCQIYHRIDALRPMPYFGTPTI